MRAGQSFAMRYPLVEVRGNVGTLLSSGNWAAERYTKARLSKLAKFLFADIDKNTIEVINIDKAKATTPGQECVFYDGEVCLGGGTISEVIK